jgi:hypothetical protein
MEDKKKRGFFTLLIFGGMLLSNVFLNGCGTMGAAMFAGMYKPNPASAVDPPGLQVDPANCAYLGGPIRAIGNYDFNEGQGAMKEYPARSIRVPSEVKMAALVHYYYSTSDTEYYGFKNVSLPPLENGGSYVLTLGAPSTIFSNLDSGDIIFKKVNPTSGKLENVEGAKLLW